MPVAGQTDELLTPAIVRGVLTQLSAFTNPMLLNTKFLRPVPDPRAVKRARLLDLLMARTAKRLNLVVAPAGFGKTTLVNQWCEQLDGPVAWLALDQNDNEPRRFWQYVAGALAHSGAKGIAESQQQLNSHEAHELDGAITALLNALAADPQKSRVLVLDDYHLIEDPQIQRQLSYFVDYLPPDLTLVITSRVEPDLPVARWRVRQWVDEIHPQMLAFSEQETQRFFEDYMALPLSAEAARRIWQQTEGWVAAMQLAALSGQNNRSPTPDDVSPIHVNSRQISDYVLTEILDQQPASVRRFLLDTACCPRLNASLCDTVREAGDSQEMLELLTRRNLFLIPLDSRNEWFRYHDLFREALYQRICQNEPEKVKTQQTRAVNWLLEHDNIQEGIHQIVQNRDWPWLARVLEQHGNNLIHAGFHLPVLEWLGQLPPDELRNSPGLLMLHIWALFFANRVDRIQLELEQLDALLEQTRQEPPTDTENSRGLRSEISLIRSYLARSRSDDKSASDLTQQVLRDIDHTRIPLKSVTYYGLGLDYFGHGDLLPAEDALRSAVRYGQVERKASTVLSSGGLLAWIQFNRGELELALDTCTSVRAWIDQHHSDPKQPTLISCWLNSALVEINRERNEPDLAAAYLAPLLQHVETGTEPGQHVIIQYVRAHLAFSQGHIAEALEALEDAESVAERRSDHILFEPPSCAALKARCYLAAGDLKRATAWLQSRSTSHFRNPLNREQSAISAARVLIATDRPAQAIALLAPLRLSTEQSRHDRHLIEVLIIYADALRAEGNLQDARPMLVQALQRAAKAGFLRMFAEESASMQAMIRELDSPELPPAWLRQLKGLLERDTENDATSAAAPLPTPEALVEPLSQREREVLLLIHEGLPNKEIAVRMQVAATTVKAHIRNLYGKLNVGSRTEALARARRLGLV